MPPADCAPLMVWIEVMVNIILSLVTCTFFLVVYDMNEWVSDVVMFSGTRIEASLSAPVTIPHRSCCWGLIPAPCNGNGWVTECFGLGPQDTRDWTIGWLRLSGSFPFLSADRVSEWSPNVCACPKIQHFQPAAPPRRASLPILSGRLRIVSFWVVYETVGVVSWAREPTFTRCYILTLNYFGKMQKGDVYFERS